MKSLCVLVLFIYICSISSNISFSNQMNSENNRSKHKLTKSRSLFQTNKEISSVNYTIKLRENKEIKKEDVKIENKKCSIYTSYVNFVLNVNYNEKIIEATPARVVITSNSLSVFLNNKEISIIDSIRLQDILLLYKKFGKETICFEISNGKPELNMNKSVSLCFEDNKALLNMSSQIKEMKRCHLKFEYEEKDKLINDYNILKYLQQKEYELGNMHNNSNNSVLSEQLKDLYYNNQVEEDDTNSKKDEEKIDKILKEIIHKSQSDKLEELSTARLSELEKSNKELDKDCSVKNISLNLRKKNKTITSKIKYDNKEIIDQLNKINK